MSERERHIKVLENLLSNYKAREKCEGYYDNTLKDNVEALDYAVASLKTDEAYQIMYEGGEIFTKDDVVDMLEELKSEIDDMPMFFPYTDHTRWYIDGDILGLIQKKIDKLKENKMEIYGIEHRKKVAEKYNLDAQEIIDLPRDKFEIFVSGLEIGEKYGAKKVIDAIKADMEAKDEQKLHTF